MRVGYRVVSIALGFSVSPAHAQVTPISELWREWVVLNRLIDDSQDEAERARKAAAVRRERRRPAAPPSGAEERRP